MYRQRTRSGVLTRLLTRLVRTSTLVLVDTRTTSCVFGEEIRIKAGIAPRLELNADTYIVV
jgi:hypothetical protein